MKNMPSGLPFEKILGVPLNARTLNLVGGNPARVDNASPHIIMATDSDSGADNAVRFTIHRYLRYFVCLNCWHVT